MRRGKSSWTNTAEARAFSRPSRPTRVKNNPRMRKKSNSTRREKSTQTRHVTNHVTRVVLFCFETQYFAFWSFTVLYIYIYIVQWLIHLRIVFLHDSVQIHLHAWVLYSCLFLNFFPHVIYWHVLLSSRWDSFLAAASFIFTSIVYTTSVVLSYPRDVTRLPRCITI